VRLSPVRAPTTAVHAPLSPPLDERDQGPESAEKRGGTPTEGGQERAATRGSPSTACVICEWALSGHSGGCPRNVRWSGRGKGAAETSSRRTIGGGGGNPWPVSPRRASRLGQANPRPRHRTGLSSRPACGVPCRRQVFSTIARVAEFLAAGRCFRPLLASERFLSSGILLHVYQYQRRAMLEATSLASVVLGQAPLYILRDAFVEVTILLGTQHVEVIRQWEDPRVSLLSPFASHHHIRLSCRRMWWRRWESNPRPADSPHRPLRA